MAQVTIIAVMLGLYPLAPIALGKQVRRAFLCECSLRKVILSAEGLFLLSMRIILPGPLQTTTGGTTLSPDGSQQGGALYDENSNFWIGKWRSLVGC